MSSKNQRKTVFVTARVSEDTREKFIKKASSYGEPSSVLREIVEAFNEDRLKMTPNPNRKRMEKLYEY